MNIDREQERHVRTLRARLGFIDNRIEERGPLRYLVQEADALAWVLDYLDNAVAERAPAQEE